MSGVGGHECMNPKRQAQNVFYKFLFFVYTPCNKQLINEQSIPFSAVDRHSLRGSLAADDTSPQEYRGAIRRGTEHMSTWWERHGQRHQHREGGCGEEREGWGGGGEYLNCMEPLRGIAFEELQMCKLDGNGTLPTVLNGHCNNSIIALCMKQM